jgi:threonine synthase
MGEGNTPLVESVHIGPRLGIRLFFKLETCNPSGSYKDRFVAAEMTEFLRGGVTACVATSSGNTGSSLAAYSARYGIACSIFLNETAPAGKLRQMQAHGARVHRVRGFITSPDVTEHVFHRLRYISEENGIPIVVSAYRCCPHSMTAVERIAVELVGQLPEGIQHVFVPVGGGGLFTAVCRGFLAASKGARPTIHAVQPQGCLTVVAAYQDRRDKILPMASTTRVSGLAVPFDLDASLALSELHASGGRGIAVDDEDIFFAQRQMMLEEGIWCEPAGAAALAGCRLSVQHGWIAEGDTVACLVTGHGFKDLDSLSSVAGHYPASTIEADDISAQLVAGELA